MSAQASQPGKTAPKLLQDLLLYDPLHTVAHQNVLTNPAPIFDGVPPPPRVAKGSCRHDYITKLPQSLLPDLDQRAGLDTVWIVAAVCKKCRLHVLVTTDYRSAGDLPCPSAQFPLHHFRFASVRHGSSTGDAVVQNTFTCSAPACQAVLTVGYDSPLVTESDLKLLTDESALERRYKDMLQKDPDRKGVCLASPTDALHRLKRYIDDSRNPSLSRKCFPARNKKFGEAFGDECDALLKKLGFRYVQDEGDDLGPKWYLPKPEAPDTAQPDPSHVEQHRTALENYSIELQILIDQFCLKNGSTNPSARDAWRESRKDIERVVGAQGYEQAPNRRLRAQEEDHPHFASLGALGDFSDSLVSFCYDRQTICDPENTPYYFDCLRDIANGRQSETLVMMASALASQGVMGSKEIAEAYTDFNIAPQHAKGVTDANIIDLYRSIFTDSGADRRTELKLSLRKLGQVRQSKALLDAASDRIETYDQALVYLSADRAHTDDTITALYTAKISDSPDSSEVARQAVRIIADERESEALHSWLSTGELGNYAMDTNEACAHLNIEQLDAVDPAMLDAVFSMARSDNPGKKTEQAIEAVRKAANRRQTTASHPAETWPVGLTSHGNTCYLNSLLQYYFTIKPLRDLVLDFEQHKFDLAMHGSKSERVGNLQVKSYEIEAYQKFADDLRQLFEHMIKDPGPAVKPEADLVCRAFLRAADPSLVATVGKESRVDDLIDVDMTGADSQAPNATLTLTLDEDAAELKTTASPVHSRASSITLQGSLIDEEMQPAPASATLPPSPPASVHSDEAEPQHAPPLPPRKPASVQEAPQTNLEKAEEAARKQQDVAEVMEDILYRLRVAIKPLGQDSREEQLDQLREIFNMRYVETTIVEGQTPTTKEEDITNLLLNVPYEPSNIYEALDRVMELHPDRVGERTVEQYRTFQDLPPMLQISIPRIDQDRKTGRVFKVDHRLYLEDVLYMDRYCNDPAILEQRQRCWGWRKQLSALKAEKELLANTSMGIDGPSAIEATGAYLAAMQDANTDLESVGMDPVDVPEGLVTELSREAEMQRTRLANIDRDIHELETNISSQFIGYEKMKYRLHAVFFHRGSSGHGHYWTYIHDFKNNIWRVYNDEKVDECTNLQDIYDAHTWQQGTPTYAVYVRDDVKEAYVEPVCRQPREPPEEPMPDAVELQDVSMGNANWTIDASETKPASGPWASSKDAAGANPQDVNW
ncbi:hypothetical protein MBLNU459_g7149t2 [Dothideomycetes sp. NU459]